jgi:chromosome segregation ATPase
MTDSTEQLKIDVAEARGIVFDLDEELSMTRIERDRLRNSLHIVNQANEGHVRMIADLAADRDKLKLDVAEARGYVFDLDDQLRDAKRELYDAKRECVRMRSERDKLLYDTPPKQV